MRAGASDIHIEPGEDVLRQFHDTRRDRYRSPARISFTQIFFRTEGAARRALDELGTRSASDLGDPSMLERNFLRADEQTVASVLGPEAAARIFTLAPGRWHGPLVSVYGFHLVQVSEVRAGEERPFDQIREQVERTYGCRVCAVLPHSDLMMELASSGVFPLRYPNDPITRDLRRVADELALPVASKTP